MATTSPTLSGLRSRRSFLATLGTGLAIGLSGCLGDDDEDSRSGGIGGAADLIGGDRASGGVGAGFAFEKPAITREQATHIARNANQLDAALDQGTPDNQAIIWIPPDAAIDYSGRSREVTHALFASTRTTNHPGGMIYSDSLGEDSAAWSGGAATGVFDFGVNAGMIGVRYRGPTSAAWDNEWYPGFIPYGSGGAGARERFRRQRYARGIRISHGSVRIENCELFGWATQAISVGCPRSWNTNTDQSYPRIRNCSIHDCGLSGYGYGVEVDTGHPVIERCFFNGCRHMVAGEGFPDCGYTLSECFFGPAGSSFPLDMHYLGENGYSGSSPNDYHYRYHSGELMRILNCTVAFTHIINIAKSSSISAGGLPNAGNRTSALVVGGLPSQGVIVQGCKFVHGSRESAISQSNIPGHATVSNDYARFEFEGNQYGLSTGFPIGQP